jgi:hypothetical protein
VTFGAVVLVATIAAMILRRRNATTATTNANIPENTAGITTLGRTPEPGCSSCCSPSSAQEPLPV